MVFRNYWHNYEKPCCAGSHKQCKTLLKDHMVRLKIISLYIYKDLGLISHVTIITWMANLVPSLRCGFGFEAAFRPEIKHFRIHKNCYFPVKFVVSAIIFVNSCRFNN